MAVTGGIDPKRQLTDREKAEVLARQGMICFIDGHPLDEDGGIEFDHIYPHSEGGRSTIDNIGAVCKRHNRDKRNLTLMEYRDRHEMRRFFAGSEKRRLDDVLAAKLGEKGYARPLEIELRDREAVLYFDSGPVTTPLAVCPSTKERYFFAVVPTEYLRNDTELQPRALEEKRVWELYQHLVRHTQLAPAVCRLVGKELLLFDGQHKAVAQVWAGRRALDCKVYVEPEVRKLKETNLAAHDKLRQMPFFTSTLIEKFAAMAAEDWQSFLESNYPKNERAFVDYLRSAKQLSRGDALKRIRSMIFQDIIEHPDNRFREYIQEENRGRTNPVTISRVQKTLFKQFITDPPLDDEFEGPSHYREEERDNVVWLLNCIVDHALEGRWAPERDDAAHKKAARIFSAGAMQAWVPFLADAVAAGLRLIDQQDRQRILYREISDEDRALIESLVVRLFSHKIWEDPDPTLQDLRYDNAERAKDILRDKGLSAMWILGGHD